MEYAILGAMLFAITVYVAVSVHQHREARKRLATFRRAQLVSVMKLRPKK